MCGVFLRWRFQFGFDFGGREMTARKERFMDEGIKTCRLTWHGPVGNVAFDIDAFDGDDARFLF